MKKAIVKSIGKEAISEKEPLIILFDESATEALKNFSVIQQFETKTEKALTVGDSLSFDKQEYKIVQVGPLADENLASMGHVTLVFKEFDQDNKLDNALYLEPHELPTIQVGTVIQYS